MDAIELEQLLLADHRRLEQLLVELQDAFNANAREDTQQLWSELERSVEAHFRLEEQTLFPRYAHFDATETKALAEEHQFLRARLAELGAGVDLKLVRAEVAGSFLAMLRAHAAREETALYRWANEALSEEAATIATALTRSAHGAATGL